VPPDVDEDFLENKSHDQYKMLMYGSFGFMLIFIVLILVYIYMKDFSTIPLVGGTIALCFVVLVFGSFVVATFMKLRDIPTHLDIQTKRVRVRYNWGEEIFGTDEILCYIGTREKAWFGSRIKGAMLLDGNMIKMEAIDDDFVDDFLALAKKNKNSVEKTWTLATALIKE